LCGLRVEGVGDLQRIGVRGDDRVQGRAFPVVRLDAIEVYLDQRATRERLRFERSVDVGDRRLLVPEDIEGARSERSSEEKRDSSQWYPASSHGERLQCRTLAAALCVVKALRVRPEYHPAGNASPPRSGKVGPRP